MIRSDLRANHGEFYVPPTTHFIVTVEDLTDMLDYGSEDIDGMDDDDDEEQGQNPIRTAARTIKHPGKSQRGDADAAQSPAMAKTATRAQEGLIYPQTPKAIMTTWTQRWSRTSQVTPNQVRSKYPITMIRRDELMMPPQNRKTVWTTIIHHPG